MNDFNIQKCKKALKSIRKGEERDYEVGKSNKQAQGKSKTDSPFLAVKPTQGSHQKTRSYNGSDNFEDYAASEIENGQTEKRILPPVLQKDREPKKNNVIKPYYAGESGEECKKEEGGNLKEELYALLYGKAYQAEKKYSKSVNRSFQKA